MLDAVTTQRNTFIIAVLGTSFCTYHVYKDYFSMLHDMYSSHNGSVMLKWYHKVTHPVYVLLCLSVHLTMEGQVGVCEVQWRLSASSMD